MNLIFKHITLTSGRWVHQTRKGVDSEAVSFCMILLKAALDGDHPSLPFGKGKWLLTASGENRNLVTTLWAGPWEQRMPLLTVGVALDAASGTSLWQQLHEASRLTVTNPKQPPNVPWIADRLETGMAKHPFVALWTGDFSRCLAWAWQDLTSK